METQPSLFDQPRPRRRRDIKAVNTPTSIEAAESIQSSKAAMQEEVLSFLRGMGREGATDEQMQLGIPMAQNTQRPRRVELMQDGRVVYANKRRGTQSGRSAKVWVAKEFEDDNGSPA